MKPWLKWTLGGVVLALLVAGALRTFSARQTRQAALDAQQDAQKTQVSLGLLPADLVRVKTLELPRNIDLSGTLKAVNTAMVKARVAGELQGLSVREGDVVKAGQVLGRIDPTESEARLRQARQQAHAAKAQVDIAQRSYDNSRALVTQGFISSTALETSQANLAAAQASYAAAQSGADLAAKSLDDSVLRAPIAGEISQRLAQAGERLAVDTRIVEIVDISHLELESALNPADALQVKVGQVAQLHIDGMSQSVAAKVARINPSATVGSRAILVYLSVESKTDLRQGLFMEGSLTTGVLRTLAVPLSAVRTDKPLPYVQIISQNQVQHQNVELGPRSEVDHQTLVAVKGVPDGAVLVSGTVGSLRAGTQVRIDTTASGTP
jgi:RND family efflux transporter MFP subunit